MKEELIAFIRGEELSPFSIEKKSSRHSASIYKTADAKSVHYRVISEISSSFVFKDTAQLWQCFSLGISFEESIRRQNFFKSISKKANNSLFESFSSPKSFWNPLYGVIVVTENEKTFIQLKELDCPVKFIIHEQDVAALEGYDLVQVIDCEEYSRMLEQLPQTIFLDSIEEVYLERHVRLLSGWKHIIEKLASEEESSDISQCARELSPLLSLIRSNLTKTISYDEIQDKISEVNDKISIQIKNLTLSGEALLALLHKSALPAGLKTSLRQAILETGLPEQLFIENFPVTLNEEEFSRYLKKQNASAHTSLAEEIRKHSTLLMKVPEKLSNLAELLLIADFVGGINEYLKTAESYPVFEEGLSLSSSTNILIEKAQPISFHLTPEKRCSILTGANSGGKTTLLEHVLQLVSLSQMGLPTHGEVRLPLFEEIYYFAKNKGSMSKGAFETLLTQLSSVKPGESTLILADEIESVTEPGVAGLIICATAQYFIEKGCFLILATHLGQEVAHRLPPGARIDGIEAKGLSETFELIVDHNPVLGKLAHSTPELIIERLAYSQKQDYFSHLHKYLLNRDSQKN